MKSYAGTQPKGNPKKVFNYRISRARRTVENTFGIISSVFRVLRKPIFLELDKAEVVVMAIVLLHNYLRRHARTTFFKQELIETEEGMNEETWRQNNEDIILPAH